MVILKLLIGQSADNSDELARGKILDFEYIEKIPNSISSDCIYKRPDVIEIENKKQAQQLILKLPWLLCFSS